ncbi:MAG: hypothetical protein LAT67_02900 [Balneolales bacterium]|nr:hypothetical protein [Balneolales bacterium]
MKTKFTVEKYVFPLFRLVPLILVIILSGYLQASAQLVLGARGTAMGQAVTGMQSDAWSLFSNPALMPSTGNEVSFYAIRYFGLSEITDVAAAGYYNHNWGTFSGGVHSYGDNLYRESRFRVAYTNSLAGFNAGIVLNYTHFSIEGSGSAGTPLIDIGIAYAITDELWLGSKATNITRSAIGQDRQELARELSVGASYRLADRGTISADVVKDVRFPVSYRGGIEVRVYENLYFRGGITTEPITYSVGMGYSIAAYGINLVAQQHYVLGWNPGLDFTIRW